MRCESLPEAIQQKNSLDDHSRETAKKKHPEQLIKIKAVGKMAGNPGQVARDLFVVRLFPLESARLLKIQPGQLFFQLLRRRANRSCVVTVGSSSFTQ